MRSTARLVSSAIARFDCRYITPGASGCAGHPVAKTEIHEYDHECHGDQQLAEPTTDRYRQCLFDWLAAHAPLWNQITYRRRQVYFSEDGDVWDAEYTDLYDDYAPILGKATCQQLARKNSESWRSHFRLLDKYHDDTDPSVTEDRYDFGHNERVTLEVRGNPHWAGDDSRLELIYDEHADRLRVQHPVRIQPDTLTEQRQDAFTHTFDSENASRSAAIDVGANNTPALVTDDGQTAVYHARPEFERFQHISERIADLHSQLPDTKYTSPLIQRLYDRRGRKRDHARDAAVRHAADWLLSQNVDTVYIGDLTDVLSTHWSADVDEKTHAFWSHRQLVDRIQLTFEDIGISVDEVSEQDTSSVCPVCRSENVDRDGDSFRCHDWTPADFGDQSWSVDQPSLSEPASSQPG